MGSEKVNRETFVRRSKLYVPANRGKFLEKAWTRGADCIILDLEDAVAPAAKAAARRMVKDDIPIVTKGGAEVQVRINREFEEEVALALLVKDALDDSYARGEGSVSVDGKMYDVANMKYVNYLLVRADAVQKKNAEKAASLAAAGVDGPVSADLCANGGSNLSARRF